MKSRAIFRSLALALLLSFLAGSQVVTPAQGLEPASADLQVRLNEVLFSPLPGQPEWVEIKNFGAAPVEISGFNLSDGEGNDYGFPEALPPVPAGAFVRVIFDGAGSGGDDLDFSDNLATLHTSPGQAGVFEDHADQCALYSVSANRAFIYIPLALRNLFGWNPPVPQPPLPFKESSQASFVAWGAAPGPIAAEGDLWRVDEYVSLTRGLGLENPEQAAAPGESIGLVPGSQNAHAADWTLYQPGEVTPGGENIYPVISWYDPPAGATLDSATFTVGWMAPPGAMAFHFQLDDDSSFGSPLVDAAFTQPYYRAVTPVPDGAYFWRVKIQFVGGESPWSPGVQINSLAAPAGHTVLAEKLLGIAWQLQHKDTKMLCLQGDAENGASPWDTPHTNRGVHGNNYCARASIAMLASYYGGRLSQDRITYEIFQGSAVESELGHDQAVNYAQADNALNWALGTTVTRDNSPVTFAELKAWIDADQPLGSTIPGHMRVIDGYREFTRGTALVQEYHVLDPWDGDRWVVFGSENLVSIWPGPAGKTGAPNVKSDEDFDGDGLADTQDDWDGDGVCDFDELRRFGTYAYYADSDDDLVPDKAEIRAYVLDLFGNYSPQNADIDGDTIRKELDSDNDYNDNNGSNDGCEDADWDGIYESSQGEGDPFDPTDDIMLHLQLNWPLLGADVDLHLIKPGSSMGSSGDVHWSNRNPDWGQPGVPCDNPTLDVDCITGCTVENIRLSKLESGTYQVVVHYYSDHGLDETNPSVGLWLRDTVYLFGPRQISDRQVWNVATIQWPQMTVTPGSSTTTLIQSAPQPIVGGSCQETKP